MNRARSLVVPVVLAAVLAMTSGSFADEPPAVTQMQPVMISLANREAPSEEEWDAMHDGSERGFFDSLTNVKSQTVTFMDTKYFTTNCAEGTLAAYGKSDGKNRFDRYGHIAGVSFDAARHSWKERYVVNAAALVQLTGRGSFVQFAGVEVETAVKDRRQIEVTFVGTNVPKAEAVRCLNADVEALEYLEALYEKWTQYNRKSVPLLGGTPPPKPKIVLANVMMLEGKSSKAFDGAIGGKAASVIHGIGGGLRVVQQNGQEVTLLTPAVRCYRTYSIEFKTNANGDLVRVSRIDKDGQKRQLPVVFDVTPDL